MVGGCGEARIMGVYVAIFHAIVCGGECGLLGMVEKDGDGVEGGFEAIGTEETIAYKVPNCAGVEVIFETFLTF